MTTASQPHRAAADTTQIDWSAALTEHSRWLRTVVLARLGGADGVDEVMQEVALAAVAEATLPPDREKLAPWLYGVAVRQALMYRRRQGRRRKLMGRYADRLQLGEAAPREADPLEWLLDSERRASVRQALERLAPRDAEVLLLKYTEGWSYRQLAERLGISTSAIEARLHRARARLRAQLAGTPVAEAAH
ncbi:MAG: sigma-70 family RNA polymerase sigma factor [Planctomycetales bacterium]|nr:sigma-70 family RNA polymerase sigma factor [Planctomycetales bacterium]